MSKLSKKELDVVVSLICDKVKKENEKLGYEIFNKSSNKDLFLSKIEELKELKSKFNLLLEEVKNIEFDSKIRVNENVNNKYYGSNKDYSVSLVNENYNIYNDVEREIVLGGIDGIDVNSIVEELVNKFKK